jgi:DUF1680 family protein
VTNTANTARSEAPTYDRPHAKLAPLPDNDVRWTEGFWAEKFDMVKNKTLPGMLEALKDPQNGAYLGNFKAVAEGRKEFHATNWSDGDCYKFVEALTHVYGVNRDPKILALMDEVIATMAAAQEPDGYINTQITATGRERWVDQRNHEFYNLGHLFTAAAIHHRITGQRNFLDIAEKAAACAYRMFSSKPKEFVHYEFNPSNIMGLVELYEVTKDKKHLELAEIFVELRGTAPGGLGDQNQDRVPLKDETEAVGHAVTATYLYSGAADVYMQTGDAAVLRSLETIWNDATTRKLYITGGVGALHTGISERSPNHVESERLWEAFGRPYQLPNASAYNETCANIGQAMWAWRMLHITGEARYGDVMEQVLYNAGLSGVSLSGTEFTYTNPLRWYGEDHNRHGHLMHDAQQRWDRFTCYCCPPQVARTFAGLHRWAYSLSDGAIWVHLYSGSAVDTQVAGGRLAFTMTTDYPWDGRVTIAVSDAPDAEVAVMLRIPDWAKGATLSVNGKPVKDAPRPGSYASVRRTFAKGDRIELTIPLVATLIEGHPRIEETRNHVAVMRGPVVYCLENHDLPKEVALEEVHLSPKAEFDLAGSSVDGARKLRGTAVRIAQNKGEQLYRPVVPAEPQTIPVQLVPYYAWNNRGITEMSVWLPLAVGV